MRHPLAQRVEVVRRRAAGLVRAHALAWWVAALVVVLIFLVGADYLLRLQDAGARWIFTLLGLAAAGFAAWKLLGPALGYRSSQVQVAHRIEKVFPQLSQRLSSAMDFMAQDERDKTAGSADLRRAVVAEADAASVGLDFRQALDSRRPALALAAAVLATLVGGGLLLANQKAGGLALARLAMPWRSDLAWPRVHTLQFLKRPDKLAVGDDFEVELVDRSGRLPDAVRMQLRFETPTGKRTESRDMKPLADRMLFRLDNVTQSFEYRATGGDDDSMPWTQLDVIEPPKVVNLLVALQSPAYTGIPRQVAGRVVKAIAGSELAIRGRTDKPIISARLRSESPNVELPGVAITSDGLNFVVPADLMQPWRLDKSASYWVELADASGLPTGRDTRVEVQVQADSPPAISWELPGENTYVTPRALVPVRALVKDDLAVARVQLRYLRPGHSDQGELVVDLFQGPPRIEPGSGRDSGDSRTIDTSWDLALLAGLAPGDVLAIRLTAEDYQPQLASSVARRLAIITEEELASRIGQRQTSILGQMAEALQSQRQCREQLGALVIRLEEKGQLDESNLNQLQSVQLNQRQVAKLLGPEPDGVEGQIAALLAELTANRVEGQALADRMNDLLAKVRALNRDPLVEIIRQLTAAYKMAREGLDAGRATASGGEAARAVAAAAAKQDEVIAALEALLGTLTEWDSFSRLAREIGQIRGEQERLADGAEKLRLAAVAGDSLAATERATAREQRQSQLELARRLDKIQGRMEQMLGRLSASDPIAAGTLADALDAGRRLAIGGQMRAAADRLGQFQFGAAMQHQQSVLTGLAELLNLLSSRREDELARTIKSLRAASGDLAGLVGQQRAVQGELDAAAAETDPAEESRRVQRLSRELEKLAQRTQELSRRLQRLRAPQAATATGQAGEQSAAAGQSAGQGDASQAQEQSRQAQRRLEEAQQELAQAIVQAEQELVQQQLARMEQWIGGLLARQKNVVAEIARIDASRNASGGELPSAMADAMKQLTAEQRLIAEETEQLKLKIAEMPAFVFALDGARQEMLRATEMLSRGETGPPPQQAATAAATRLAQLLSALEPDTTPPADPPGDGQTPPTPPGGQPSPLSSLAALKLLQLLQGEISRRTSELESARSVGGEFTDEQKQQLEALAQEQGRLADMVLNLIRESAAAPEDQVEAPPAESPPAERNEPS